MSEYEDNHEIRLQRLEAQMESLIERLEDLDEAWVHIKGIEAHFTLVIESAIELLAKDVNKLMGRKDHERYT